MRQDSMWVVLIFHTNLFKFNFIYRSYLRRLFKRTKANNSDDISYTNVSFPYF